MGLSVMKCLLPFEIWSRRALRAAVQEDHGNITTAVAAVKAGAVD